MFEVVALAPRRRAPARPALTWLKLPDGRAGVRGKLKLIRRIVDEDRHDPRIRALVVSIWRGAGLGSKPKAHMERAAAILLWAQQHLVYVHEPIETFTRPRRMLLDPRYRFGDCDEFTSALMALYESAGYQTRAVACGWPSAPGQPAHWRHVYPEVLVPPGGGGRARRWLGAEGTVPGRPLGWSAVEAARARLARPA